MVVVIENAQACQARVRPTSFSRLLFLPFLLPAMDNPYLAHRAPHERATGAPGVKEPLYGFVPRMVTAKQVEDVIVSFRA